MGSLPKPAERRAVHVGDAFRALLRLTARRVEAGTRSPATLAMQREHVRYLTERIGRTTPVASLTQQRIARLLEQERAGRKGRALSGSTLRKRAYTLSQALELARGRAPKLPEIPYLYQPRTKFLESFDDYERLRDRLAPDRRLWFLVAAWTGQRRSDVEKMVKEDFDPRDCSIIVRSTKTRGRGVRIHAADPLVRELLPRWEQLPAGAKLVPAWPSVNSSLRWHCKKLGLPLYSTHVLRHTFFTWYVQANGFTPELLAIGGWKTLRIPEQVYAHALPVQFRGQIERAAAFATSLRRPPQKIRASETGTVPLRDKAKRNGPAAAATATGPVTSPEGTLEAGLKHRSGAGPKQGQPRSVPRDRVELSTHGFSDPCEPAHAFPSGLLPMEGPPCPQEPRPAPT